MSTNQLVISPQNSQVPAEDAKAEFLNCGKCPPSGKCLMVCIDGTSKKFGAKNSNVVELYGQVVKSERQLTYYNSGIGTYVKPTFFHAGRTVYHCADRIFAFNFKSTIIDAYRWLSENYEENDRIYLFGVSRGAYQVRALAGMLHKIGLIHKGNEKQIPFAYDLYVDSRYTPQRSMALSTSLKNWSAISATDDLAPTFKKAFARDNIHIHFVGVWDTVSSVGVGRKKNLPNTNTVDHICFFRHALALDERRVKFLPEYVHVGLGPRPEENGTHTGADVAIHPKVKEVWFPGTHSDIGGGNDENLNLKNGNTPLLWMSYQVFLCDLKLEPLQIGWNWEQIGWHIPGKMRRLFWKPHWGSGRQIQPGQKIHASVAFCSTDYHPRAKLAGRDLQTLVGSGTVQNLGWANSWKDVLEMDIFDHSTIEDVLGHLTLASDENEALLNLHRLMVTTWSQEGLEAMKGLERRTASKLVDLLEHNVKGVQVSAAQALGALSDKYNLMDIGQRAIGPLCDMCRDADLKNYAAKTLCRLLGNKYRVDCPPSSNVQTATILLSIFKDTAQEPNVRLHSLHALIRNRYGIGIVEQEISGAGLNQDVRYCLRHNHSTNSTAGIFLDIASHPEFGKTIDMAVTSAFLALIEGGTEFHRALERLFELYDKFSGEFKRELVGPKLGTIVKNALKSSCRTGLQLLNSTIPVLKHAEVREIVTPEIAAVFEPWLDGDSVPIEDTLETLLRCINQEDVRNKFININIINRLDILLGHPPVIKSWSLANLSHMVEDCNIPKSTLDRMSRAIEVLLVDDDNELFERALGSLRRCFDSEYVRTKLIQDKIFDRLDRDTLFHRSANVKFGVVNMFSLGMKDGNLPKGALDKIAPAMKELLRDGDNRTVISTLINVELWLKHKHVRSKLIQGRVFDNFDYLFARSTNITAWVIRILSNVMKDANIAERVLDRIAPAIKELLRDSDNRTVISALTSTRSWLRHEGVRSKLIQKRIFDNFDSLFDRSPDMTRLVVDILSLVMEDGDIAGSTLDLIPSAVKSLLRSGDSETVVSTLMYTEWWLGDDRVRPKLLQERVFDELEPLFDRLADMTRYFVRILSLVMKDDIATKTLNRIAPAIKALLCDGSDNGTVISALSYTRSWLEHKHVRSKLIQERVFDNFDSFFDRSPDMTLLVVDILTFVMKDGDIAGSTLDLIPSAIKTLLHSTHNGTVTSALEYFYSWLEHEHVRSKLIQEKAFNNFNNLFNRSAVTTYLVVSILSLVIKDGDIAESTLNRIPRAIEKMLRDPDEWIVLSALTYIRSWLEHKHVRSKLLQGGMFKIFNSLQVLGRSENITCLVVDILSLVVQDANIPESTLDRIAPAIKGLLGNKDNMIVNCALRHIQPWLEHEYVRSKLIQERVCDNFDSLFDRSPDMTLLLVGNLTLVMEDGDIAESTLDKLPPAIKELLRNSDNETVVSALMHTQSLLKNKHVRSKLIQEKVFENFKSLFNRSADITNLVVDILSLLMKDGDINASTLNRIAPAIKELPRMYSDNGRLHRHRHGISVDQSVCTCGANIVGGGNKLVARRASM